MYSRTRCYATLSDILKLYNQMFYYLETDSILNYSAGKLRFLNILLSSTTTRFKFHESYCLCAYAVWYDF